MLPGLSAVRDGEVGSVAQGWVGSRCPHTSSTWLIVLCGEWHCRPRAMHHPAITPGPSMHGGLLGWPSPLAPCSRCTPAAAMLCPLLSMLRLCRHPFPLPIPLFLPSCCVSLLPVSRRKGRANRDSTRAHLVPCPHGSRAPHRCTGVGVPQPLQAHSAPPHSHQGLSGSPLFGSGPVTWR